MGGSRDATAAGGPAAGRRERLGRIGAWSAYVPLALVVLSLVTLAVVPALGFRRTWTVRQQTEALTEPARTAVTEVHLALAIEGDAVNDFLRTGDTTSGQRYRRYAERLGGMLARLDSVAPLLEPEVVERLGALRTATAEWHRAADSLVRRSPGRPNVGALQGRAERYEDALLAAARLDDAIGRAAQRRHVAVAARERRQAATTVVLALVALVGALAVGWTGRRLRRATADAEARRVDVERLMEARVRLMRGVTHDLRNPLQVIAGHAGLLHGGVGGPLTVEQARSVDHIRRGARLLVGLIDDLTELWHIEAGQLVVRHEPTDPTALVRAVADGYRPIIEAHGLRLVVDVPAALPGIMTDRRRVRHVLSNLLANAAKYTPVNGAVAVSAGPLLATVGAVRQRWLSVSVSDTGCGIPPDKLEAIFDEFVRLDPIAQPGSGLGLAISRRVARLLGGDITVTSEVGRGSTFTVWLPLLAHDPARRRHATRPERSEPCPAG